MLKKLTILSLAVIIVLSTFSAGAVEIDDFDKNLLSRVFENVNIEDIEYMSEMGLDSKDIGLILYYYSNSDKKLDENELDSLVRNRERINEFHNSFGMPGIIFEDDLVRFRHPYRERNFPPLDSKKYDKKYEFNGGTEIIKVRGKNYDYKYNNQRTGVEEKIEIKNQKYEYYYRDRNMIERLDVHHANNKYSYYYRNLNTGHTIKKEGRGRNTDKDNVYEELEQRYQAMAESDQVEDAEDEDDADWDEKYEDQYKDDSDQNEDQENEDDSGIDLKFDIEIDLSDLFN